MRVLSETSQTKDCMVGRSIYSSIYYASKNQAFLPLSFIPFSFNFDLWDCMQRMMHHPAYFVRTRAQLGMSYQRDSNTASVPVRNIYSSTIFTGNREIIN